MATIVIASFGGKSVVWPPVLVVKPGEEIQFKAVGTSATVFLPKPDAFRDVDALGAPAAPTRSVVAVGAQGVKIKVKGQAATALGASAASAAGSPAPGIYPYAVYCKASNDFAEGNSSPVMIIEPPDPPGGLPWPGSEVID
jgi:hypothetical protein